MQWGNRLSLGIIDVLGAGAVMACLTGFVWSIAIHNSQTVTEISELQQAVRNSQRELRRLDAARDRQATVLASRQAELVETGQLPSEAPVDQYFQTLSVLASQHSLRVVRHNPLTPCAYPGMLEQRYAYEVAGSMPDLIRFLRSIEGTEFWADVSYLKLNRGRGAEDVAVGARVAELTISIFSALPVESASQEEGT